MRLFRRIFTEETEPETIDEPKKKTEKQVKPSIDKIVKEVDGKLDMVIAFDTTGSMAAFIDDVRREVSELIPRLFRANPDLRLGIVAFGDYCDMPNAKEFGDAYQSVQLTDNENSLIKFVKESRDTDGGDGDEFYELVIKKIVEETNWRNDSKKSVLLIADSVPHEVGYSYLDIIQNNNIDWHQEALKAAKMGVQFDTLTIRPYAWFKELSNITNGLNLPFYSSSKTAELVEMAAMARGGEEAKEHFRNKHRVYRDAVDEEMCAISDAYRRRFGF